VASAGGTPAGGGQTRIVLPAAGQDALHRLLARLQARKLPLVSVARARPSMEEVFVHLVRED
jgi:hypothetical protein